jgi:hypothetical protein
LRLPYLSNEMQVFLMNQIEKRLSVVVVWEEVCGLPY